MFTKVSYMDHFRTFVMQRASELGLSQNEVAKRAKKTSGWLSKFLNEPQKDLRLSTFIDLANALQVSPLRLIGIYIEENQEPEKVEVFPESYRQAAKAFFEALSPEDRLELIGSKDQPSDPKAYPETI